MTNWLTILKDAIAKKKLARRLKWQASLAEKGIGIRTEVLEIKTMDFPSAEYVYCSIRARLRVKGKMVYRWVNTLNTGEKSLQKGDVIHLRYRPEHLYNVLVV